MSSAERQRRHRATAEQKPKRPKIDYRARQGTDKAYTLVRLYNQRRDLYSLVVDKKLSAHAAAVLAGFRQVYVQVPDDPQLAAAAFMRLWGPNGVEELIEALQWELKPEQP